MWRHSPSAYRDLGLTDKLYGMLRDHDSNVVTFTLQTLNIILADEGGVRVNKKMARYLLSKVWVFGKNENVDSVYFDSGRTSFKRCLCTMFKCSCTLT